MSINGPEELAGMRAAGAIVRRMLEAMKRAVRPGISTAELDQVGAAVMREHGAQSAPPLTSTFNYGAKIPGMKPEVSTAQPETLQPDSSYALLIESGTGLKGEKSFTVH